MSAYFYVQVWSTFPPFGYVSIIAAVRRAAPAISSALHCADSKAGCGERLHPASTNSTEEKQARGPRGDASRGGGRRETRIFPPCNYDTLSRTRWPGQFSQPTVRTYTRAPPLHAQTTRVLPLHAHAPWDQVRSTPTPRAKKRRERNKNGAGPSFVFVFI